MATYTVKQGDSLARIAGLIYGNQRMFQRLSEANGGVIDLKPGMILQLPDFDDNPVVTQDWFDQAQKVTNQYTNQYSATTQSTLPPVTTELLANNPGVDTFVAGGTYKVPRPRQGATARLLEEPVTSYKPQNNASFGVLGGAMGGNTGGVDKNRDRQSAVYGTKQPAKLPVGKTFGAGSTFGGGQNLPKVGTQTAQTPIPTSRPPLPGRARGNEPVSNLGAGVPTKFGQVENRMSDRGRPTAEQVREQIIKTLPPSMFVTQDDTTGKEYFMQENKNGTFTEMKRDVTRSNDPSLQWVPTGENYYIGEDDAGNQILRSVTMDDTWKAWDSFGQVPQTFSADWAITLGLNATFMKKWGFTLDPNTMTWYQPGSNPTLGSTSYSGTGMSSGTDVSIPEFLISPEDWAQGYRPDRVSLSQAAKLGVSDAMMRENGYVWTAEGWVKAGSQGTGTGGGGVTTQKPIISGGYTGYPSTQNINRRISTG